MSNDRYYTAGTREALFMLSRGYCYEPTCKERVMRWTGSEWRIKVFIAHIIGLKEGSARHRKGVPQLNNFKNLILLCKIHHDQVDGEHTWINYPEDILIKWKTNREGDLADELDQLDWITQDKLQGLMADAIEETLNKIMGGIDNITSISKETLGILKTLVDQTLKLPYLDPNDIASLEYCAEVFETLPDYVHILYESARNLKDVPEYSEMLYQSARRLDGLADNADILYNAARQLTGLSDNADILYRAGRQLTGLSDNAPQLLEAAKIMSGQSLWSYKDGVREIQAAVDTFRRTVASLSQIRVTTSGHYDYHKLPPATMPPAKEKRPWNYFWWGVATNAFFVIIVLTCVPRNSGVLETSAG